MGRGLTDQLRVEVTTKGRIKVSVMGADPATRRQLGLKEEIRLDPVSRLKVPLLFSPARLVKRRAFRLPQRLPFQRFVDRCP